MDLNTRKERFSLAYVSAVAAHSGYAIDEPKVDRDSIDGMFSSSQGNRPRIEFQLKSTSLNVVKNQTLKYDLPIKNYNDLRVDSLVPRILIVVLLPKDIKDWTVQSTAEMCLRHCGYWISLTNSAAKRNRHRIRISIPQANIFDSPTLTSLMR